VRNGARVVVASRERADLERLAETLRRGGGEVFAKAADISAEDDIANLVAFTMESCGGLCVAVNRAAIALPQTRKANTPIDDFDRLMRINTRGLFLAMKHELNAMLTSGGGSIVNVSSVGGLIGSTGRASYVASKHAVGGLTKSAALEYARNNIRV